MADKPFDGAKLKIKRAFKHSLDLKSEIDRYLARDPWGTFVQRDKQSGNYQVALMGREQIPKELAAIFGDAVHNLRAALDLLANDLVRLAGTIPKNVYFPFAESEVALERQIKDKMKGAPSDILNIVRSLRPYRGGNAVLRGLHDLDIVDKHKAIMRIATVQAISPPMKQTVVQEEPLKILMESDFSRLPTVQIDMTGFKVSSDAEIVGKVVGSTPGIFLANGLPFADRPITSAIAQMGREVQGIVKKFEDYCLKPPASE